MVYRDNLTWGNFLFELGEAVAVDVGPESSTLQATMSRDAFLVGDYVALNEVAGDLQASDGRLRTYPALRTTARRLRSRRAPVATLTSVTRALRRRWKRR